VNRFWHKTGERNIAMSGRVFTDPDDALAGIISALVGIIVGSSIGAQFAAWGLLATIGGLFLGVLGGAGLFVVLRAAFKRWRR